MALLACNLVCNRISSSLKLIFATKSRYIIFLGPIYRRTILFLSFQWLSRKKGNRQTDTKRDRQTLLFSDTILAEINLYALSRKYLALLTAPINVRPLLHVYMNI